MFDHLSAPWLIALGAILCFIFLFIFKKIRLYFLQVFKPFKKGQSYWCRVTAVSDGDTLSCYRFNFRKSKTKIRFAYVDAPESNQSYGLESQRLVKKMVHQKIVRVKITDIDRYGRCVGVVYRYRKNMNEELVKRGAAWVYEEYIRDPKQLKYMISLQEKAKRNKRGLWRGTRPVRPSTFRKQKN